MRAHVYTTADAAEWRRALDGQAGADVYHLPGYHVAAELNGEGSAFCFVAEEGADTLVHPVLLRPIEHGLADLESVYGYSGPLSTTRDAEFLAAAWAQFDEWSRAQGVVAEFVRFNPLSANEVVGRGRYEIALARTSVILALEPDEDALWRGYPQVQRNMVRRARREGLAASRLGRDDLAGFERLYHATMNRVGAEQRYLFSSRYFAAIESLDDHALLLGVRSGDELVAAAFFLLYGDRMHYHLAGSSADGRRAGANNLLLHEAAIWGGRNGYRVLHLGGGVTADPRDPLLRFKTSVSRATRPASVGRRVHDRAAYDRLCEAWLEQHRPRERPGFFLLWRLDD